MNAQEKEDFSSFFGHFLHGSFKQAPDIGKGKDGPAYLCLIDQLSNKSRSFYLVVHQNFSQLSERVLQFICFQVCSISRKSFTLQHHLLFYRDAGIYSVIPT